MRIIERGWVSSNMVVFCGGASTDIVDTGYSRHAEQTLALVRHALGPRPLDRILGTHAHADHIGGNAVLKRAYPAVRIGIPAGDADLVHEWDEEGLHLVSMGQQCERFNFDLTVNAGDLLTLGDREWRAIASPGHDMNSLMLWCEHERILITADALWEDGFGILFPALPPAGEVEQAFAAQEATLDAIAALEARLVIPGHGAPFVDVTGALGRARSRLDYFMVDPARIARNAAKVTLSFLLMIEGRLQLSTLAERLARLSLLAAINHSTYGLDDARFAALLAAELVKSRAATCVDGWLHAATR